MIPNIFHFVFGMAADFGGKPFSLVHYLAIKSSIELNKPGAAIFHYQYEPVGEWWMKIKPRLTLNRINAPAEFMGKKLFHVAHKADVVRLRALQEQGGIYLDLDTISVKPLHDLYNNSFVIGEEMQPVYKPKNRRQEIKHALKKVFGLVPKKNSAGLCNAVLLSEKDSEFVNRWLGEYSSFRSQGRDKYWNEHSVIVPMRLAEQYPASITRLGPYAFHYPLYTNEGLKSMFEETNEFPAAYLHHLWESFAWDKYMVNLTPQKIMTENSTYNLIARKYL